MGAITGTLVGNTEFAGEVKLIVVTATVASASDEITLTAAAHGGAVSIVGIVSCVVTGGLDAAFLYTQASFSGLVITIVSLEADGTIATGFSDTTISVAVLVKTTA